MDNHKLGIIVPYRDRQEHLDIFKKHIVDYFSNQDIDYELIIVEQDDEKLFNRGILLNIGFKYAEELGCDYVVFHDVDMLPIDVDYSYSNVPLHLATGFEFNPDMNRIIFDTYFGGVTLFPMDDFRSINGYSNKYWGWGYEDDDLLLRCTKKYIELNEIEFKNQCDYLNPINFNGFNSYIKGLNNLNIENGGTIFVSFYPKDLIYDHTKPTDTFSIFSIPGYDLTISYNSFSRYNFCCFDNEKNALYVNSNLKTNYVTTICVTIDEKKIKVYQDGEIIGIIDKKTPLFNYNNEKHFYLGVGNGDRDFDQNFFKGYFYNFIFFNEVLDEEEVRKLPNLNYKPFLYYDVNNIKDNKLIDLSGNGNDGIMINCGVTKVKLEEFKIVKIPHRRKSLFRLLNHEENGFFDNKWKTQFTRWNQLRFNNEVSQNRRLLLNDGLSDLLFTELEKNRIIRRNIVKIKVQI